MLSSGALRYSFACDKVMVVAPSFLVAATTKLCARLQGQTPKGMLSFSYYMHAFIFISRCGRVVPLNLATTKEKKYNLVMSGVLRKDHQTDNISKTGKYVSRVCVSRRKETICSVQTGCR